MKLSEILIQILKKRSHNLAGGIIAIFVVPIVINLLVFIGLIRAYTRIRKSYNGINGMLSGFAINICDASLLIVFFFFLVCAEAQYDYGGQSKLRFDFRMILTATDDFSFENKIGQGGFGSVYKVNKLEKNYYQIL